MLRDRIWRRHLLLLAIAALGALALGYRLGYPLEVLLAVLLLYLVWIEMHLYQLFAWLKEERKNTGHHSISSLWRNLYASVLRLERRNRKRKRRFNRLLGGFRDSMSALPDATVVLSKSGEIEWWNSVATTLLGFRKEHAESRKIDTLIRDPAFDRYLQAGDYKEP
ncbi:MAG: phosphate regulon sensor protein PhoR, partial [Gammaproteobacteria bacterium]